MTEKRTVETSRQIKDYVFCSDCEQLLSKNDEAWVLGNMARGSEFPLQAKLRKATPIETKGPLKICAGGMIADIDVEKPEYFALSVFWRGAVHPWRAHFGASYEPMQLGPYLESLRLFLLGWAFPQHVITIISVCDEDKFEKAMFHRAPESRGLDKDVHTHFPYRVFSLARHSESN